MEQLHLMGLWRYGRHWAPHVTDDFGNLVELGTRRVRQAVVYRYH